MSQPLVRIDGGAIAPLWHQLDLELARGEFLAVLGPNGVGKSTLLAALLGQRPLTAGTLTVNGRIGYIPQQRLFSPDLPLRAWDLVSLAAGHGIVRNRRPAPERVEELLAAVGASSFAQRRIGQLSGGQQQLIRQAQALARSPEIVLADEPLLSLDPARQRETVARLDQWRRGGAGIIFVTHSVNPVIDVVDRILYLGPRGHLLGTVSEVMQSAELSRLYGAPVKVVEVDGRMVVI